MKINADAAINYAKAALIAARGGVVIDASDANAIYSYIFSIFAIGAGLVPEVGPLLAAFTSLLGAVLFPSKKDPNALWNNLRKQIETLIGAKIQESQVKILQKKVVGFAANMKAFTRVYNDYEQATGHEKAQMGQTLREHHIAFLAVIRAGIPEFQVEDYAVAALPLFTQAANMHLTLLSDGIKHGVEWGWPENYVKHTLQVEFDEFTVSSPKRRIRAPHCQAKPSPRQPSQQEALKESIATGEAAGWDAELLDTWREALEFQSNATAPGSATAGPGATLTYPAYVKKYYEEGRKKVKPYTSTSSDEGRKEALHALALSDYDTTMIKNVLTPAEFWPYMAGKEMPESAQLALDREIFSGPYGRYTKGATWDAKKQPPVTERGANITAVKVRHYQDIDSLQVQYGGHWGPLFGDGKGGVEAQANLAFDEYIEAINVTYGEKLGQLTFGSNKNKKHGGYGAAQHAHQKNTVSHPGFGLTSMVITNWEAHAPPGCEGVIFGFRPLLGAGP
ncbi:Pesticidal crystal protein Cry3Ba [Beauveria bassiana]|uniref:Pesticidal crystal protein Cry3Ba n=1 Tax=Beauveria bassiana TaxID=176275 RepID=A0A2N6NP42_BEABA|nr:Pesticidal crystal protein Cry3Ba [Beauveria bassiana]